MVDEVEDDEVVASVECVEVAEDLAGVDEAAEVEGAVGLLPPLLRLLPLRLSKVLVQ